jgi:hypothetical protein
MANLYYNAAVDNAWDTLGNWWTDAAFTNPALALPATGDTVYLAAYIDSGPSVAVTLTHIYVADASTGGGNFGVNFTGAIGNATFNDYSYNVGLVSGDATFNGGSANNTSVSGNATFNDYSYNNGGTVSGDATFNDNSYNDGGTVSGDATFSITSAAIQITYSYNGSYGSVTIESGTAGGGNQMIARLLNLPWFINI